MAARNFTKAPEVLDRGLVDIIGSFAPNGSSAVSATSRQGQGWSVAYTSTGLFTITTTDKFADLVSASATLQLTTADDKFCQIGVVSLSAKTIQIRVIDASGAALADVSADAGNRINFRLTFRNTSALPVRG